MNIILKTYIKYLEKLVEDQRFSQLADLFRNSIEPAFDTQRNGNLQKWLDAYRHLPPIYSDKIITDCPTPSVKGDIDNDQKNLLLSSLHNLHPWRKGPFELFDIFIDAEWRSDWKWERIASHINDWKNQNVLDIGCGNGYHCFRIAAEGARTVTGIDTSLLSIMQFKTLQKYFRQDNLEIFPVGIQNMPLNAPLFDTLLSMGVLYHRKDHIEHLKTLKSLLVPGGKALIETLVIDGGKTDCLIPEKRYAMMKNVYTLPSLQLLEQWISDAGFCDITIIDVTVTSINEQRSTEWMKFHSLINFLDKKDQTKTVEGYQAPKRAMLIAYKKD